MAEIISSYTAHVHSHLGFHFGFQKLFPFAHCVVQPHLRWWTLVILAVRFAEIPVRRQRLRWPQGADAEAEGWREDLLRAEDGGTRENASCRVGNRREEGSVALEKRQGTHFGGFPVFGSRVCSVFWPSQVTSLPVYQQWIWGVFELASSLGRVDPSSGDTVKLTFQFILVFLDIRASSFISYF